MNLFQTTRSKKTVIGVLILTVLGFSQHVDAAGTASNTTITNSATVNYQVNSVAQDPETSNVLTFLVDNRVNLNVVTLESATISVTPGSTGATNVNVLRYTVTNTGNTVQDFAVSATAFVGGLAPFSGTDNIDASAVNVFVDGNSNGTYESGTDTATFIDELAVDVGTTVFIVSDFASTVTNGQIAAYHLLAEARAGGASGGSVGAVLTEDSDGDDPNTVEIVFGDAAGTEGSDGAEDATFSDDAQYTVAAATLSIVKSSTVISDPFNGTSNPLAIPGAVIEYTVVISNAASTATATSVAMTDSLNTEITASRLAFNIQYNATPGQGVSVGHPDFNAGAMTEYTNANDGVVNGISVDWNVGATNTVTVSGIQLDAGESATVRFRVTIQ